MATTTPPTLTIQTADASSTPESDSDWSFRPSIDTSRRSKAKSPALEPLVLKPLPVFRSPSVVSQPPIRLTTKDPIEPVPRVPQKAATAASPSSPRLRKFTVAALFGHKKSESSEPYANRLVRAVAPVRVSGDPTGLDPLETPIAAPTRVQPTPAASKIDPPRPPSPFQSLVALGRRLSGSRRKTTPTPIVQRDDSSHTLVDSTKGNILSTTDSEVDQLRARVASLEKALADERIKSEDLADRLKLAESAASHYERLALLRKANTLDLELELRRVLSVASSMEARLNVAAPDRAASPVKKIEENLRKAQIRDANLEAGLNAAAA
ncbi:hypothetical protein M427DRAFT_60301 [Gonapodya prolifera JEL478]|uniref:Uncharacterized protein n=1 Tax=Gonapodya prolifera (strain JEL478) TaxID=1344416 RepID=A0A139A4H1_GONPJ|nr:hypothetical protein M427DRAFT_60301 [Gonapodya prolifera JEL478]|eukprot:KXS11691.1 hypothetical protein M427DRAFT_60301 [Gonapodya prolifera JEL478]